MLNEKSAMWCLVATTMFFACSDGSDGGQSSGSGGASSSMGASGSSTTSSATSGSTTSSSSTGTSGAGGTSGSTGSGGGDTDAASVMCGIQAGACVNTTDCAIGKAQIDPKVATCARGCAGGSKCTADCLVKEGVTTACAQCWGDVTQCGRDNCLSSCYADPSSTMCRECTKAKGCDQGFTTCSGW